MISSKSIAILTLFGLALHIALRISLGALSFYTDLPLIVVTIIGGGSLIQSLILQILHGKFGADFLAGLSIVTAGILGEYLAGAIIVLMLSGGRALEAYGTAKATDSLTALVKRMPSIAHVLSDGVLKDLSVSEIQPGVIVEILPHELCPVDGVVVEGHGSMNESYLTGEPYEISKAPGSAVFSGAINGEYLLRISATRTAKQSRYASILKVMEEAQQHRPRIRRIGDMLGAAYTPFALGAATLTWIISTDARRFLSVLVVATPCPLLLGIPIAVIGAISLCARRGIIIRDPSALEEAPRCKILIADKTGTLTLGRPVLTEFISLGKWRPDEILQLTASVEQYSRHPLSHAILEDAKMKGIKLLPASEIQEEPGKGLNGKVDNHSIAIMGRDSLPETLRAELPSHAAGLECVIRIDGDFAALIRFRDEVRPDSRPFISHLGVKHGFRKVIMVSGDRESEVSHIAKKLGISEAHFSKSPEEKFLLVSEETKNAKSIFLGDGINDAPALSMATVGIAFGASSDVTTKAGRVVILDSSLSRVDEFLHISVRMRRIALQSAVGGMAASLVAVIFAAFGLIEPVIGAILQEGIDLVVVANALRVGLGHPVLRDY